MILGVIPARIGSTGIPKKNIKMCAGKPLIAWTILSAQQSTLLDDFVVSTEDLDIVEISQHYGSKITQRPKELATDTSPIIDTLKDIVNKIPCDNVVLLQPTSPIRSFSLIDKCIKTFQEEEVDSLATGFECKFKPYGTNTKRRQDYKGFLYDDGSIYVIKSSLIKQGKLFTNKFKVIQTSKEENIEIDDEFDFWLAEQILLRRMRND